MEDRTGQVSFTGRQQAGGAQVRLVWFLDRPHSHRGTPFSVVVTNNLWQEGVEEVVAAASHSDHKEQLRWTAKSPQSLPARQRAQSGGNCRQPGGACNEVGRPVGHAPLLK